MLREELLAITNGHAPAAVILDRFLFWADRGARSDGWIWKSAKELSETDLMGMCSTRTAQRSLKRLVEVGYLKRRENPDDPLDNVLQYRADVAKISDAVEAEGYNLGEWVIPRGATSRQNDGPLRQNGEGVRQNGETLPRTTSMEDNKKLLLHERAKDSTGDPDPNPSPPTTIEEAREAFDDLDDIDALDQWIIQCCALFDVQMGIGAAMSLAKELTAEIEDPKKARRYVRQRLTEMAGDVPPRSIRRYIMADARQWRIKDQEAPPPKSRGNLRGGEVIYSERGKRAFEEVEEYDWTFEILDDEESEGGEQ